MGLSKPKLYTKFEVACPSRCRYIIGEPITLGSSFSPGPPILFPLCVILWWALANPSCKPSLKSLALSMTEIRESVIKRQIRFLGYPLRELMVTYGLHLYFVGKRVVHFLFAITELFRDNWSFFASFTATLIRRNRLCWKAGHLGAKYQVQWLHLPPTYIHL